jgi:phage repressor protein C with HTH and peptisase S24 domain|nr:MAG TPA: Repressor protein CI [Caudoviricetes sp.]
MSKIIEKIKSRRRELRLSQQQLADRLGWRQSRIGNYEAGVRDIGTGDLRSIAEALEMTFDELVSGNYASTNIGNQTISGSSVNITTANQINHGTGLITQPEQAESHTHRIDYLDVRAAAGLTGFENSDYPEIVSSLFLSDEGLLQIIGRKSAAGIKIVNVPTDSMEPTIRKGDWVFLDTNVNYYNGDGVYAFAIDNALFIKRIQKLVGGGYRLHSDNKDYDPQDITDEICQTAKFVGRFIKTIHIDVVSL